MVGRPTEERRHRRVAADDPDERDDVGRRDRRRRGSRSRPGGGRSDRRGRGARPRRRATASERRRGVDRLGRAAPGGQQLELDRPDPAADVEQRSRRRRPRPGSRRASSGSGGPALRQVAPEVASAVRSEKTLPSGWRSRSRPCAGSLRRRRPAASMGHHGRMARRWNGWGDEAITRDRPARGDRPSRGARRPGSPDAGRRPRRRRRRRSRRAACRPTRSSRPTRRTGSAMPVARASATGSRCGAACSVGCPTGSAGRRRRPRSATLLGYAAAVGARPSCRTAAARTSSAACRRPTSGRPRAATDRSSSSTSSGWPSLRDARRAERARDVRCRGHRAGARGGAPGPGPDARSRAAVVGVLDARRLGRHPLVGTALARVRPDRGALRRRPARGAGRNARAADPPGFGRRARPAPARPRLGGPARDPRRGDGPDGADPRLPADDRPVHARLGARDGGGPRAGRRPGCRCR